MSSECVGSLALLVSAIIILFVLDSPSRRERWEKWYALGLKTGLTIHPSQPYAYFVHPYLRGNFLGHRVTIESTFKIDPNDDENSIPWIQVLLDTVRPAAQSFTLAKHALNYLGRKEIVRLDPLNFGTKSYLGSGVLAQKMLTLKGVRESIDKIDSFDERGYVIELKGRRLSYGEVGIELNHERLCTALKLLCDLADMVALESTTGSIIPHSSG